MSTPPSAPPGAGYEPPYYRGAGPPFPVPNPELLVFLLVWVVVAIVTLATDDVNPRHFVTASIVLAVAYMLSRGIAKAGKVIEER